MTPVFQGSAILRVDERELKFRVRGVPADFIELLGLIGGRGDRTPNLGLLLPKELLDTPAACSLLDRCLISRLARELGARLMDCLGDADGEELTFFLDFDFLEGDSILEPNVYLRSKFLVDFNLWDSAARFFSSSASFSFRNRCISASAAFRASSLSLRTASFCAYSSSNTICAFFRLFLCVTFSATF